MLLCLVFLSALAAGSSSVIVQTKYGAIDGFTHQTASGFTADVFLGVPYAEKPVNELRFQKPQPPQKWDTFTAHNYGQSCAGQLMFLQMINATEDCLYMNIARPSKPSADPSGYPVMFWIHGGAFIVGAAYEYHNASVVDSLVSKGVIFVSINYRLGPFGFFSSGNDFPGNYGLWDQIQALKFLKEIALDFGGNPDKVTIFGESAGGASVSWLTINPETKHLFRNAIMMSGSHYGIWANSDDTKKFSAQLLKEFDNDMEKLKKAETADILKYFPVMLNPDSINFDFWNPVLADNYAPAKSHEEADQKAPKKTVLIGLVSLESAKLVVSWPGFVDNNAKVMPIPVEKAHLFDQALFESSATHLLSHNGAYGDQADAAIKKIIKFYVKEAEKYTKVPFFNAFSQFVSDLNFNLAALKEARAKAAAGFDVYFYLYDFVDLKNDLYEGTTHADELGTFFGDLRFTFTDESAEGYSENKDAFIDLFTSLAVKNRPEIGGKSLDKVEKDNVKFVRLGNSGVTFEEHLWESRLDFWDQIAADYGFDWVSGTWIDGRGDSRAKQEL